MATGRRAGALGLGLLAAVGLLGPGCGDEAADPSVELPPIEGAVALAAVAPAGEPADPRFVLRIPVADGARFLPAGGSGVTVDGFVGGLVDADLPEGMVVASMPLVAPLQDAARPLPPLRSPHVLGRPSPVDQLSGFVPVDAPTLDEIERAERRARLDALLSGIWVRPPCVGDPGAMRVLTPRTPAESFLAARSEPDGTVVLGLVATGTAAMAAFPPGAESPELIGIDVPTDLELSGRQVAVRAVGPPIRPRGPARHVVLDILGAFDRAGLLLRGTDRGYRDDTPLTPEAPVQGLRGVVDDLDLDGAPTTCAFGSVRGPQRDAGLWCRTLTSTTWSIELRIPEAQAVTGLFDVGGGTWAATDRAGAIHVRDRGRWRTVSEAAINQTCRPLCAAFEIAAPARSGTSAVWAGAEAQLLRIHLADLAGSRAGVQPVDDLFRRAFVDERQGGERALSFVGATEAPDGRWWLGTAGGVLFRADAELARLERVCLPGTVERRIAAIATAPDGRLVLGVGTGQVVLGRWDL